MIEKEVIVTTKYGSMPCLTIAPEEPGRYPAIIFYMDARGIREELRNMARRVAKGGYYCILPDMYYRMGTIRLDTSRPNDDMANVWRSCYNSLSNAMVVDDTAGILSFLDGEEKVKPGKVSCLGYCMSGQFVTTLSAYFPTRFASAASLYGTRIITDSEDSPHKLLGQIKGEMYYAFAEIDRSVPLSMVEELRGHLDKAGTKYEIDIFPGAHHGFAFPERDIYSPLAAEQTWAKMFALWQRTLK